MSGTEATRYDVRNGAAWITMNRPENRNALSAVLVNEVYDHFQAAIADPKARAIVITGAGPAFCAGADLKNPPGSGARAGGGQLIGLSEIFKLMMDGPKPVIAAVNGAAFAGGLGLLGAADIVIIAEEAQCSFSEVRIGVIPAVISVVCARKLGVHHATKLFITGERFNGQRAVEVGLAHRAVPRGQLEAAVQEEVDMIVLGGPIAVTECKKLARNILNLSIDDGLEQMAGFSKSFFQSPEGQEGMAAFREKRPPKWVSDAKS